MENAVYDQIRKSCDVAPQLEHAAHAAETLPAAAGSVGVRLIAPPDDFIAICAWHAELHVLRVDRRPGDVFTFSFGRNDRYPTPFASQRLEKVSRHRRGEPPQLLKITATICPACREKHFGKAAGGQQ
jgi:hypothetical protein